MVATPTDEQPEGRSGAALLEAVDLNGFLTQIQQRHGLSEAAVEELEFIIRRRFTDVSMQSVAVGGTIGIMAFFQALVGVLTGQFENIESAFSYVTEQTGHRFDLNVMRDLMTRVSGDIMASENEEVRLMATVVTGGIARGSSAEALIHQAGLDTREIRNASLGMRMFNHFGVYEAADVEGPPTGPMPISVETRDRSAEQIASV